MCAVDHDPQDPSDDDMVVICVVAPYLRVCTLEYINIPPGRDKET